MFWGSSVKSDTPYNFKDEVSPLLHLSNATLTPSAKGGQTHVFAKVDGKDFVIAVLEKGKVD